MFNYVPIKHKQMSFVSNGGKFKLYTVLNGLIFPTPTQPRISFEPAIIRKKNINVNLGLKVNSKVKMCRELTEKYFRNWNLFPNM
jgi:hypothetical protein